MLTEHLIRIARLISDLLAEVRSLPLNFGWHMTVHGHVDSSHWTAINKGQIKLSELERNTIATCVQLSAIMRQALRHMSMRATNGILLWHFRISIMQHRTAVEACSEHCVTAYLNLLTVHCSIQNVTLSWYVHSYVPVFYMFLLHLVYYLWLLLACIGMHTCFIRGHLPGYAEDIAPTQTAAWRCESFVRRVYRMVRISQVLEMVLTAVVQ